MSIEPIEENGVPGDSGSATGLPTGHLAGGFISHQAMLRQVFALAEQRNWQKLVICDPNFEAWPLGEAQVVAHLNAWSGRGKELVMLAHRFDWVQSRCARFVNWRNTWSHIVSCCTVATTDREVTQGLIWTPEWALKLQDQESFAAISSENPRFRAEMASTLHNLQQRSRPGFAVNILGL